MCTVKRAITLNLKDKQLNGSIIPISKYLRHIEGFNDLLSCIFMQLPHWPIIGQMLFYQLCDVADENAVLACRFSFLFAFSHKMLLSELGDVCPYYLYAAF